MAISGRSGISAAYDGDGVRLGQVVNGQAITYTLDLAAPLVTVLAEAQLNKRITYLYGLGDSPLAGDDGAAWVYLSGRDALNSVRQETDAAGLVVAARSFDPYGVPLSGDGGAPFGFTGEYRDSYIKLQWLRARWLDSETGRFVQPDTIIADFEAPVTLNAYLYSYNNPLGFTDPSGHAPVCPGCMIDLRMTFYAGHTLMTSYTPVADRMRRDKMGGGFVVQMADVIAADTSKTSTDSVVVSAILRHESAAVERWLLDGGADCGETLQASLKGETASIGPGQMQVRRARELEELGYVTPQPNQGVRVQALLRKESAVAYVTGMVQYLGDQLQGVPGFDQLPTESQQRILLIGYNQGWDILKDNIDALGFERLIERSKYDDQTLDEYLRWSASR